MAHPADTRIKPSLEPNFSLFTLYSSSVFFYSIFENMTVRHCSLYYNTPPIFAGKQMACMRINAIYFIIWKETQQLILSFDIPVY